MAFIRTLLFLCVISWTNAAATPLDASIQVRNAPGRSVEDTYRAIRRGLAVASLEKREDYKVELPLEKSWDGATLLSVKKPQHLPQDDQAVEVQAGIEVTCQTCYVKGLATAQLTISDDFDANVLIDQAVDDIRNDTIKFAQDFKDYLKDYMSNVATNVRDDLDWEDFDFPTFPFDFSLDVPEVPECNLRFQFDDMELYMEINTVLTAGATYEINLFASQSVVGMRIGPMLQLGVVLQVDLILQAEGAIDISSGFHIKLDDGVVMDIKLFGDKVSNMIFNGGQFEFLPVTLESASVSLAAILRIGMHCGIEVERSKATGPDAFVDWLDPFDVTAGVEIAVFANVAEFVTNVTYAPDDKDCRLKVVQEYNLALGAIAGASVLVDVPILPNMTWGPVASATIAIFTTTLSEVCGTEATAKSIEAATTAAAEKRDDLTTTTINDTTVTTGVSCKVTGIANCPNSEQVSTRVTITRYLTTAVESGVEPTFPNTTFTSVQKTVAFGSQVKSIKSMSGSPTPYVAPPDEEDDGSAHTLGGKTGGVSNKVIVGVCVGVVLPVLAAIIGAFLFFWRRKRHGKVNESTVPMVSEPYTGHNDYKDQVQEVKTAHNDVSEMRR